MMVFPLKIVGKTSMRGRWQQRFTTHTGRLIGYGM